MKIVPSFSSKLLPCLLLGLLVINSVTEGSSINTAKENDAVHTINDIPSENKENSSVSSEGSGRSLLLKSLILAPLGLTLLALVAIALLPIPAITIPVAAGRNYMSNFYQGSSRLAKMAKDVLTSDSCMERVSCEISRTVKHFGVSTDIHKVVSKVLPISSQWKDKMSRGFNNSGRDCAVFHCSPHFGLKRMEKT